MCFPTMVKDVAVMSMHRQCLGKFVVKLDNTSGCIWMPLIESGMQTCRCVSKVIADFWEMQEWVPHARQTHQRKLKICTCLNFCRMHLEAAILNDSSSHLVFSLPLFLSFSLIVVIFSRALDCSFHHFDMSMNVEEAAEHTHANHG